MADTKATARIKKINAEAQEIRKQSPKKKWSTCLKEAGKKVKKSS